MGLKNMGDSIVSFTSLGSRQRYPHDMGEGGVKVLDRRLEREPYPNFPYSSGQRAILRLW